MDLDLAGRVAIVTGGTRGIGKAVSEALVAEGCNVAVCGRDRTNLDEVVRSLRAATGARVLGVSLDLSEPASPRRLIDQVIAEFGCVDILVNNASASVHGANVEIADQVMGRITGKLLPAVGCSMAALPHMKDRGWGRIVFIGGVAARQPISRLAGAGMLSADSTTTAQGAGNAAIVNFAKHLSDEYAGAGILMNVVHPGVIAGERFDANVAALSAVSGASETTIAASVAQSIPLGRVVQPEEVARIVVILASAAASGVTGQSIAVDGGLTRAVSY